VISSFKSLEQVRACCIKIARTSDLRPSLLTWRQDVQAGINSCGQEFRVVVSHEDICLEAV
jgi:hypothetical protein